MTLQRTKGAGAGLGAQTTLASSGNEAALKHRRLRTSPPCGRCKVHVRRLRPQSSVCHTCSKHFSVRGTRRHPPRSGDWARRSDQVSCSSAVAWYAASNRAFMAFEVPSQMLMSPWAEAIPPGFAWGSPKFVEDETNVSGTFNLALFAPGARFPEPHKWVECHVRPAVPKFWSRGALIFHHLCTVGLPSIIRRRRQWSCSVVALSSCILCRPRRSSRSALAVIVIICSVEFG